MQWWETQQATDFLQGFAQYQLRGAKGSLTLERGEAEAGLAADGRMRIYPNSYSLESNEMQWSLVRADIVHEVAHRRFTGRFPNKKEGRSPAFPYIFKVVEDNRIEYKMVQKEYMGRVLLPKRSKYLKEQMEKRRTPTTALEQLCYQLWAYSLGIRCNTAPRSFLAEPEAQDKWAKIQPLLDRSFRLPDADHAILMAQEIERIIFDLDPEDTSKAEEMPGAMAQAAMQRVGGSFVCGEGEHGLEKGEGEGEGDEGEGEEGMVGSGNHEGEMEDEASTSKWSQYLKTDEPDKMFPEIAEQMKHAQRRLDRNGIRKDLKRMEYREPRWGGHGSGPITDQLKLKPREPGWMLEKVNQVMPIFRDALKYTPPREVADLSRAGGRLSIRDYLVDETRPFISMLEPKKDLQDVAIRIIGDVSGSMQGAKAEIVTLFAMALHNACQESGVHYEVRTAPLNILLADNNTGVVEGNQNIMSMVAAPGPHEDMGVIVEQHCQELLEREEQLKMIICLHDGQSNDANYLKRVVHHYRKKGVTILGVGLASQPGVREPTYSKRMFAALEDQFDNDFLVGIDMGDIPTNHITDADSWPQVRGIPQRLARVIRNFRKRS